MEIKAILFDKDGTLMDHDSFWIDVSVHAAKGLLSDLGREDIPVSEILEIIGVYGDVADKDGLLCKGTYGQIGAAVRSVLCAHGVRISVEEAVRLTVEAYENSAGKGEVIPICENLREVLENLKNRGIKLAVVTVDTPAITHACLEKLGIEDLFVKIYADDGKMTPKPDPACALDFSSQFGIPPENMLMVGDTMTDINFAKNSGIFSVGVGGNDEVSRAASAAISDISQIHELIEELS